VFWHAHKWYALVPPDVMLRPGEASGVDSPPLDADAAELDALQAELAAPSAARAGQDTEPGLRGRKQPLLPEDFANLEEGLSTNSALIRLPVDNITAFTENLRIGFLPGTTLMVDFPFPAFPDHLGHWAEIMQPTYSVLANGSWKADAASSRGRYVDRIVLPNLRKVPSAWGACPAHGTRSQGVGAGERACLLCAPGLLAAGLQPGVETSSMRGAALARWWVWPQEMNDWFKETLALAVAPGVRRGGAPVPPLIDYHDLDVRAGGTGAAAGRAREGPWGRLMRRPLAGWWRVAAAEHPRVRASLTEVLARPQSFPKLTWLAIENLLVIQDRCGE
jgi:hypothetical protein